MKKNKILPMILIALLVFGLSVWAVSFLVNQVRKNDDNASEWSEELTGNTTATETALGFITNSTYTEETENSSTSQTAVTQNSTAQTTATSKPPQTTKKSVPTTISTTKPPLLVNPTTKPPLTTKPTTTKPTPVTSTKAPAPPAQPAYSCKLDNLLGKPLSDILAKFGNPVAKEKSEYGFIWYIYHKNYSNYIMVGIQNNSVVGLYSNSPTLSFEGLKLGVSKKTARGNLSSKYTGPLTSILKDNTEYVLAKIDQRDVFSDNEKYITVFYDATKGGVLTAIQIIAFAAEQGFGSLPAPNNQISVSYERICFYLTNAARVRNSLPPVRYDKKLEAVCRAHSLDMLKRNYFSHTTPEGIEPKQRIQAAGINYRAFGENIAKNHPGAISSHEGYMNNTRHRASILGNYTHMGVGVAMGTTALLQTQLFVRY